jgi:hypothetical protein
MYPILITNGLLTQPRPGVVGLMTAILHRKFKAPRVELVSQVTEVEYMQALRKTLQMDIFDLPKEILMHYEEVEIEECARLMGGAKGRNLMDAHRQITVGAGYFRKKEQMKWNEIIKRNPGLGVKPRVIEALTTAYQAECQSAVRGFTNECKRYYNMQVRLWPRRDGTKVPVTCVIADPNPKTMHIYADAINNNEHLTIILNCDDVTAAGGDTNVIASGEAFNGDFSMYDQTQFRPHFERLSEDLKFTDFPTDSMMEQVDAAFTAKVRDYPGETAVKIEGHAHSHEPTGWAGTSIVGSVFHVRAWRLAVYLDIPIAEAAAMLGFKLTMASTNRNQAVFLRHWLSEYGAIPVPSQCLKLGKIFKHPEHLTKSKGIDAYVTAFAAVTLSVQGVPDDYPILGAFLRASKRLTAGGLDTNERVMRLRNDPYIFENARYKVHAVAKVPRQAALEFVEARYGLTEHEVCEIEALFESVDTLPAFVNHEGFLRLRDVDY